VGVTAHRHGFETDDTVTATLRFESGALGSLTATSAVAYPTTSVHVHGTKGSVIASGTSPDGQGGATLQLGNNAPEDITAPTPLSFVAQLETVSLAAAGEDVAYASGADGARNVELLERISP
jgi:predicted dehydrogenase